MDSYGTRDEAIAAIGTDIDLFGAGIFTRVDYDLTAIADEVVEQADGKYVIHDLRSDDSWRIFRSHLTAKPVARPIRPLAI